jgi:hypothetical protein
MKDFRIETLAPPELLSEVTDFLLGLGLPVQILPVRSIDKRPLALPGPDKPAEPTYEELKAKLSEMGVPFPVNTPKARLREILLAAGTTDRPALFQKMIRYRCIRSALAFMMTRPDAEWHVHLIGEGIKSEVAKSSASATLSNMHRIGLAKRTRKGFYVLTDLGRIEASKILKLNESPSAEGGRLL